MNKIKKYILDQGVANLPSLIFGLLVIVALAVVVVTRPEKVVIDIPDDVVIEGTKIPEQGVSQIESFKKFASAQEFEDYLADADNEFYGFEGDIAVNTVRTMADVSDVGAKIASKLGGTDGVAPNPERVSETNVQVVGIDEPDILKTNGKEIYFSPRKTYRFPVIREVMEKRIASYSHPQPKTTIVKAFPVDKLAEEAKIDKVGDLLLVGDTLVVFTTGDIYGYNVSNPKLPKEKWKIKLDNKNNIVQARLYNDTIYLVTRTNIRRGGSCVTPLFEVGDQDISLRCVDIYHPAVSVPLDTTYTVSTINPVSGEMKQGISFVGSYDSTVYMSTNAMYIAYSYRGDEVEILHEFFKENGDLIPASVTQKIEKVMGYDISNQATLIEVELIIQNHLESLTDDEELVLENELENRAKDYLERNKRDLQKLDIVKVAIESFKIKAYGTIPGKLLNQFSLDEYGGHLRVATTVGQWFWMLGFGDSVENENDIYVLGENLDIVGEIKGLGIDERIYSARFIEDKGYLVTFKQIDPFFVLDLSNPAKPEVKGELKIPGYSAYLHPITKDKILGVGKEGSQVKISLFDVSSPSDPKEADKYTLKEYWTDVLNTHHAFLLDKKHKVFFIPGRKGGYVFSYKDDELKLVIAVSDVRARRAVFIDDLLYIVGDNKIIVLDENTWKKAGELEMTMD